MGSNSQGPLVCLISPPTVTDFEDPAVAESQAIRLISEHAPLGILSLAAVLEQTGNTPRVIDLNHWYYEYLRSEGRSQDYVDFCAFAVQRLESEPAQVYGFSTICSSYPLTLRMAQGIKRARPDCTVVLGGPQASVVDAATVKAFSFVDFVVRGEAEETFPQLLGELEGCGSFETIAGLTYLRDGVVRRNAAGPVINDLDLLPLPAFHLYTSLSQSHYMPLELGRGCPFGCTFCSTNDFFRRRFRLKSPARMIEQMRELKRRYGIDTFDLVHDMFTVDRKRVVGFCRALLECGETFYWSCSARTDCIDEELTALMAEAGCRGIFFGIETGSPRMQKIIQKNLDLDESMRMIECNDKHKIKTAVSVITGFPEENLDDFRQSIAFIVDSLRFDHAHPQLHILAPLAETPIHQQYRDRLTFDYIISDMSYQGWRQGQTDLEMIHAHPDIFANFYAIPTPGLDRRYLKEVREFILHGMERFRWLLVALHQLSGDLVDVFDLWLAWRRDNAAEEASSVEMTQYYGGQAFCVDFLHFVESCLVGEGRSGSGVLKAMLEYETGLRNSEDRSADAIGSEVHEDPLPLPGDAQPRIPDSVLMWQVSMDYQKLLACLRRKEGLNQLVQERIELAIRQSADKRTEVIQLSDMSAQLIRLCNGSMTVDQICESLPMFAEPSLNIPAETVCRFGLEVLRAQRLIAADTNSAEPCLLRNSVENDAAPSVVDGHAIAC